MVLLLVSSIFLIFNYFILKSKLNNKFKHEIKSKIGRVFIWVICIVIFFVLSYFYDMITVKVYIPHKELSMILLLIPLIFLISKWIHSKFGKLSQE
jgi:ABC-type multidrug transport system fused ATPase/permease subunit